MKYVDACEHENWHLNVWHPDNPESTNRRLPYRCRSWRHKGPCQLWRGACDFCRVRDAVKKFARWTYCVFTNDQKKWTDTYSQYRGQLPIWAKVRKRLVRAYGPLKYIQTWERFRKGGCHVNVLIHNSGLYHTVETLTDHRAWRWMNDLAEECGWGWSTWVENMRGGGVEMAGYLTKLARELVGAGRKDQVPYDAPPHFRRLRASQKTLPPVNKTDYTGVLRYCSVEAFLSHTQEDRDHDANTGHARHRVGIDRHRRRVTC